MFGIFIIAKLSDLGEQTHELEETKYYGKLRLAGHNLKYALSERYGEERIQNWGKSKRIDNVLKKEVYDRLERLRLEGHFFCKAAVKYLLNIDLAGEYIKSREQFTDDLGTIIQLRYNCIIDSIKSLTRRLNHLEMKGHMIREEIKDNEEAVEKYRKRGGLLRVEKPGTSEGILYKYINAWQGDKEADEELRKRSKKDQHRDLLKVITVLNTFKKNMDVQLCSNNDEKEYV